MRRLILTSLLACGLAHAEPIPVNPETQSLEWEWTQGSGPPVTRFMVLNGGSPWAEAAASARSLPLTELNMVPNVNYEISVRADGAPGTNAGFSETIVIRMQDPQVTPPSTLRITGGTLTISGGVLEVVPD